MPNGNAFMVALLSSPLGRLGIGKTIAIDYTGPKSGRRIQLPVTAAQDGDRWIVSVGMHERKKWYKAFRRPLPATITSKGESYAVTGVIVTGADREEAAAAYLRAVRTARFVFNDASPVLVFTRTR